ncbi:hypothetical protein FF38_01210 [Lucilia cuprina]|uniref:CUE domain-containing protein n=1 Tax=Lucilia cuprina TaxID=7375 RepID=A0A0L0BWW3_LUCCU|nr:hypothetical protein FF38_01210 [Lucilia cuprina]
MPTNIVNEFKNPENKSLKDLFFPVVLDDGVKKNICALDKYWAPRSIFSNYTSLVVAGGHYKTGAALQEWQHEADNFKSDLEFLLSLKHHEFWSYMVFQKSALGCIVSFLQKATPFYINICSQPPTDNVQADYETLLNLVLRIICRLLTPKESADCWLKKDDMRELIYKNYLISVPMLFDLLVAVGNASPENAAILQRIFDTLLSIEPNYKKDLIAALNFFRAAFRSIQTQTENEGFEGAGGGLPDDTCETPFDDVALYTLDCAFTLSVLLDVCPAVRSLCGEIKLGQSIANFYDNTLSFLYKNIYLINETAKSLMWLNQARLQFLQAFRSISYSYVEEVLAKPKASIMATEEFIGLLTECLSEQTFVIDYERHFSVALDMEILKQACEDLDTFKANFVVQGYQKEAETAAKETINNIQNLIANQELLNSNDAINQAKSKVEEKVDDPINKPKPSSERDLELEVTMVLDCLPHLGTGFVRKLISRYDSSEEAIAAVLENNLPPDLAQADHSEVYIPADPQDKLYEQTGIKHFNIYDGDKYDIMTQDNPQCIIKQGKGFPNAPQNATQLLDDKRDLAAIKHRYQEYSLVTERDSDDDEYNDEYDDSYEALLESETRVVKSKDLKNVLANVADVSEDETESEEEESSQQTDNNQRNKNDNFCENPEDIRARYEARRQAKWAKKGNFVPQQQPKDVVGRAKGQGQEKDVLRNRQKKEANKSSRANHNRKAGAAFKQSKGMF